MALFFAAYIPLYSVASARFRQFLGPGFVACAVLVTLLGIYLPYIQLYFGAIAVLFACTVRGRVDATCRYILLAAIVPQMQLEIGAVGHHFGMLDSAGVLGLAAYGVAAFDRRRSAQSGQGLCSEDFLVLAMFLIMAIGTVGFGKWEDSLRAWVAQFLLIVMPYILFRKTLKDNSDYRTVVACFGAASVFLAVFAIFEARMSTNVFNIITTHLTGIYVRPIDLRGSLVRASATMNGPLELACFMTVGIFALACSRDYFRNATGYYGSLGIATLGLLATQSRGSLIAILVSAVVLCLALRKRAIAAVAAIVAAAAWPMLQLLAAVSPGVAAFINGSGAGVSQGQYYDYRNLLLERGLEVAAAHPFTGMRMTEVLDALADLVQGEGIVDLVNVYLVFLLISGIVGLLPFLALTINSGLRATLGFKRVSDAALLRARGFTLAAFSVVLFQFAFVSLINRIPMVFVLSLAGIRLLARERKLARLPSASSPGIADRPLPADTWVHGAQDSPDLAFDGDPAALPRLPMISR